MLHRGSGWSALTLTLALSLAGCAGADSAGEVEDAALEAEAETAAPAGLPFRALCEQVEAAALGFELVDGDWQLDFGDAAFYGLAYHLRAGLAGERPDHMALAEAALARNLALVELANEDTGIFLDQLDEVLMALLGLIEVMSLTGEQDMLPQVDALIDRLNTMVDALGTYLDIDWDTYALYTYGPTTITGLIALLNLRYADLLDTPRSDERAAHGVKVIDAIDEAVWTGSRYCFCPDETKKLYLYPHMVMLLANGTAHRVTAEARFLERGLAIHQAIQPLKDQEKQAYRSPYSAETMGATTEDYITLSSQNYTMLALALLFELTGDEAYREEIEGIAGFIQDYLLAEDGRILHHWMDGRVAIPSDLEYFCTGCNHQFLYVCSYVEEHLYTP
jgi:hypothetical protein